jgi:class 3 adenylate cyclase
MQVNENKFNYIDGYDLSKSVMKSHDNDPAPKGVKVDNLLSMDEVFLKRLKSAIEANIENKEFGVDELGHEIGMSRSQIHRKLQALSGKSASRYIRSYKLEKARDLLRKNVGNVAEISDHLGFSSPAYFGQVYVEEFGYPPSEEKKGQEVGSDSTREDGSPEGVRRLAAIMFTDIVGYTAMMGNDEQKAMEILRQNRAIQKPLIEQNNGKWLKEIGDGVLAQFDSAYDSVLCALKIQRAAMMGFDAKIRIGIHLGDVTIENEDVFGDGVNIASRLQDIADPGGVYISEGIQRAIRGRSEISTQHLGEVHLKNVDYLVSAYCLVEDGLPLPSSSKIQQLRASTVKESGAPLATINDQLIREVFDVLVEMKPSISRFLVFDEDLDEEPDVRELADQIIRNYPWVMGVELRRLFSGSMRVMDIARLNQILITIHRTLQFLSFVLIIELFERVTEGKIKLEKEFILELKARFLELTLEDIIWIIKQAGQILDNSSVRRFFQETKEHLNDEFYENLDFEVLERNSMGDYKVILSEDDISRKCIEYQEKLTFILKRICFITKYKLVTVKEIKVLKNRHKDATFKHWLDILNSSDSDFRSKEETFDSYSDSNAVLMMKSIKRPDEFLNLSPLIIDTRAEVIDTREKFSLKKDIFICEGFANNNIRYKGTEVTEESDLRSLSNYHELVEDFRRIIQMSPNSKSTNKR